MCNKKRENDSYWVKLVVVSHQIICEHYKTRTFFSTSANPNGSFIFACFTVVPKLLNQFYLMRCQYIRTNDPSEVGYSYFKPFYFSTKHRFMVKKNQVILNLRLHSQ